MAQNATVMAFRKRLKHHGYTDIHIYKDPKERNKYEIIAIEPLGGNKIKVEYTTTRMQYSFR